MFKIILLGVVFACVAPFFIEGDDGEPMVTPDEAIGWVTDHIPQSWVDKASDKLGVDVKSVASAATSSGGEGFSFDRMKETLAVAAELQQLAEKNGTNLQDLLTRDSAELRKLASDNSEELQKLMTEHGAEVQRLMSEHGAELQALAAQKGGNLQTLLSQHQAELQQVLADPESARRMAMEHKDEIKQAMGK